MKNIFLSTLSFLLLLTISSCENKDQAFPEFETLEKGSFPRLINQVEGLFDYDYYDNPDTSFIEFEVEFYDENQGNMVESYSWDIRFGDFGPVTLVERTKSDFIINSDGLPSASFRFTLPEVLDVLGMTIDDIIPDTQFEMAATLKRTDGKVFTSENTGSNVIGQPTYQGFFEYRPDLLNFPKYSILDGCFDVHAIHWDMASLGFDPCNGKEWEGKIRWEAQHDPLDYTGVYKIFTTDPIINVELEDMSMGLYYACFNVDPSGNNLPLGDLQLKDDTGVLSILGSSQWGELWTIGSVIPIGAILTLKIFSDYGEGGTITITRNDGEVWPDYLTCEGC